MPHAQYLKGTEDRKTSVFLPDLPWSLPVGADGRLAELQAEAFHGTVPVPPRLPPDFRPGIQIASPGFSESVISIVSDSNQWLIVADWRQDCFLSQYLPSASIGVSPCGESICIG